MDLHPFPELETERLVLRRITPEDADCLYELYADEQVTRFIDIDTFTSQQQATELLEWLDRFIAGGSGYRWGIYPKETNHLVGTCGYHRWDRANFRAEIGYDLGSDHWGQGYMREALQEVLSYGFAKMGLNRVEALVDLRNIRSQNLLQGMGFRFEGILRQHSYWRGRYFDDMSYSLLRREWD